MHFAERVPNWLIIKNNVIIIPQKQISCRFKTIVSVAHKMKTLYNGRCTLFDQCDHPLLIRELILVSCLLTFFMTLLIILVTNDNYRWVLSFISS